MALIMSTSTAGCLLRRPGGCGFPPSGIAAAERASTLPPI